MDKNEKISVHLGNQQTPPGDNLDAHEGDHEGDNKPEKIEFTDEQQAEVNRIVQDRLDRQEKKHNETLDALRKELDEAKAGAGGNESGDQASGEEVETLRKELDAERLKTEKALALLQAGYTPEQLPFALKNLDAETPEAIGDGIQELSRYYKPEPKQATDIGFPKFTGNGARRQTGDSDGNLYDQGRQLARRIFDK